MSTHGWRPGNAPQRCRLRRRLLRLDRQQARLLRSGELNAIDAANIAEEIESMGRSDRRAIESRLIVPLTHLLKWQKQSKMRSASWSGTLAEPRRRIAKL